MIIRITSLPRTPSPLPPSLIHCLLLQQEIRLGLNEDLIIGREERRHGYGAVVLDDCTFHENADMENFDRERILSITAPDGEVS